MPQNTLDPPTSYSSEETGSEYENEGISPQIVHQATNMFQQIEDSLADLSSSFPKNLQKLLNDCLKLNNPNVIKFFTDYDLVSIHSIVKLGTQDVSRILQGFSSNLYGDPNFIHFIIYLVILGTFFPKYYASKQYPFDEHSTNSLCKKVSHAKLLAHAKSIKTIIYQSVKDVIQPQLPGGMIGSVITTTHPPNDDTSQISGSVISKTHSKGVNMHVNQTTSHNHPHRKLGATNSFKSSTNTWDGFTSIHPRSSSSFSSKVSN